jgi:hypothetical protein
MYFSSRDVPAGYIQCPSVALVKDANAWTRYRKLMFLTRGKSSGSGKLFPLAERTLCVQPSGLRQVVTILICVCGVFSSDVARTVNTVAE